MVKTSTTPQEIEVWYILPAIRRELAKVLIWNYGLKQKDAAELLGITGAAISQYLKSKRAKKVTFDKNIIEEIRKSAARIIKNKNNLVAEVQKICNLLHVKKIVCKIHKEECAGLSKNCCICFK